MNKEDTMKEEVPDYQRCIFCSPLRHYGLITWGYFKLIVGVFIITVISYLLLHTMMLLNYNGSEQYRKRVYGDIGITAVSLTLIVTDFFLTMLFIFGAQRKNVKLLRIFYAFSIVTWVITTVLAALAVCLTLETWLSHYTTVRSLIVSTLNISCIVFIIIVQGYFLLLLRSEIIKLKSNGSFQLVNNEAKATCKMNYKETPAGDDTDTDTEDQDSV